MALLDNTNTVVLNAGNNFSMPLFINCGTIETPVRYKLKLTDTVYFAICEANQDFMHALVRKTFTKRDLNKYGDVNITLEPSDTKYILSGQYYYEVRIKLGNGNIATLTPRRKLIIT